MSLTVTLPYTTAQHIWSALSTLRATAAARATTAPAILRPLYEHDAATADRLIAEVKEAMDRPTLHREAA